MKFSHSKFVRVQCNKCKNEQIIFGKTTTEIKCLVCNAELANPTGGKSDIKGKIMEVLN